MRDAGALRSALPPETQAALTAHGSLRDYEARERPPQVRMPVLFTAGRHDEAVPSTVAEFQRLVAGSRPVVLENSAHMTPLDEPEAFTAAIRGFLCEVEAAR